MQKKYGILRFVGGFYKVVGIILGVITLFSSLGICLSSILGGSMLSQAAQNSGLPLAAGGIGLIGGIIGALISLIFGALGALGMYAVGELISLLISVEENTRYSASQLHSRPPSPVQPAPQVLPPQ